MRLSSISSTNLCPRMSPARREDRAQKLPRYDPSPYPRRRWPLSMSPLANCVRRRAALASASLHDTTAQQPD
jgi:hypothetical protein